MATPELSQYLNSIGRHPVLTPEAQLRHCRRIREWLDWPEGKGAAPRPITTRGRRSVDAMVRTNLRLVVNIALKYQGRGVDLMDLVQEGSLGLVRGLELFDPTRGYTVGTFCYWWIRQGMTRAIQMQARTIRLPIHTHDYIGKLQRFTNDTFARLGRSPTLTELSEHIDQPPERVRELLAAHERTLTCSLDVLCLPGDRSSSSMGDMVACNGPSPEELLTLEDELRQVTNALDYLPAAEAHVVRETFLRQRTMKDVGAEMGANRSKVAAIQRRGLMQLRRNLALGPAAQP
jgi:RNA polymerase sigma factor (sigma-70 family)